MFKLSRILSIIIAISLVTIALTACEPGPGSSSNPTPAKTNGPTTTKSTQLSRDPVGDCQALEQYITPDDPVVIDTMNDILNSNWSWAYSDFKALQEWVVWHVTYTEDFVAHGQDEYFQLPSETIALGTGDCEDFAILLCSLLRAYGVPDDEVYVGCGYTEDYGHAFLFEHWYEGYWRAIEPQQSTWITLFLGDMDTSEYSEFFSFNDQDCFDGKPALPSGVYETEVGYSLGPLLGGTWVEYERSLNAGQSVTGSVEWYGDSGITYDWYLSVYNQASALIVEWSGTDQHHDFSFTASSAGTYTIRITKMDILPRVVTLEVNPTDWYQY